MKIKNIFLIILFTILVSQLIYSQNYFPLAIGNKWQFVVGEWDPVTHNSSSDTTTIEVIKDTLAPNNVHYFVLNGQFPLGEILRSDSLGVYYYDNTDSTDCLVYDYNSELNHPYTTGFQANSDSDSPIVTLNYIDSSDVLSHKVKILSFSYNWMIGHNITLGENIGPVYLGTSGDGTTTMIDYILIGYKLNEESFGSLTSVENNNIRIDGYKLYQNYPNPFNPTTTISYSILKSQIVELSVYDILGNKIANLVNGYKQAGNYSIRFNASYLSSGVYIYKLIAGNFIQAKKLVFLK